MRVPLSIESHGDKRTVVFLEATRGSFTDPFFLDTLGRLGIVSALEDTHSLVRGLRYAPDDRRLTREPLDLFIRRQESAFTTPGIIFHSARCGSTLLSQMLVETGQFDVYSEPPILNAVLDPRGLLQDDEKRPILRATFAALGETVAPTRALLIKLRSWNTLYAPTVLAALSDAQWLFLHRNGVEVLASVLANPPGWLRARAGYAKEFAAFLGVTPPDILALSDEEYAARFVGALCRTARSLPIAGGMFVDYDAIATDISAIALHWGRVLSDAELERVHNRMQYDSKDLRKLFAPDSRSKRDTASIDRQLLARTFIDPWRRQNVIDPSLGT